MDIEGGGLSEDRVRIQRQNVEIKGLLVRNVDGQNVERKNFEWDKKSNGKKRRLGQKIEVKKRRRGQNIIK
jgi:hypothetical protein